MRIKDITAETPTDQPLDEQQLAELVKFADALDKVGGLVRSARTTGDVVVIGPLLEEMEKDFE